MIKLLCRFNEWYDGLREPRRFFFFLFALMGWIPLMYCPVREVLIVGSTWMAVTMVIVLVRLGAGVPKGDKQ